MGAARPAAGAPPSLVWSTRTRADAALYFPPWTGAQMAALAAAVSATDSWDAGWVTAVPGHSNFVHMRRGRC